MFRRVLRRPCADRRTDLITHASRRASVLGALTFVGAAVATLAAPSATLAWTPGAFNAGSEQQLLSMTNEARANAGLKALRWDATLASIARGRSQDMIERNYFEHNIPPSGRMVWDVLDQRNYCYNVAGENIGWNMNWPDDQATPQIEQSFIGSSEHRSNILGRAWDSIGIGAYKGDDGKIMWTVLFADHCGSVTPPATTTTRSTTPSAPALPTTPTRQSATLQRLTGTHVVEIVHGSNNVAWVKFTFPAVLAGQHVQILRATRDCGSGSGSVLCSSGRTYGGWSPFSVLTTRVVDASGAVYVALSTQRPQWLSVAASFSGTPSDVPQKTATQQVRWR